MKISVTGRSGRMGQAVLEAVAANPEAESFSNHDTGEDLAAALKGTEAVIDFTTRSFTTELVKVALAENCALVIGTTGHSVEEKKVIQDAATQIPIVFAPNFSVGVNTLFWLTRKAARLLGNQQFDIEVVEMHHRHKIDAPSGTAVRLLEILQEETATPDETITHGRVGNIGARPQGEIGMHTLRGGDVVGDHTVLFAADGERFELTHKASSRQTFASGAVRAALWLRDQKPGLYDMEDVLELR